jgi:hypothetical protein
MRDRRDPPVTLIDRLALAFAGALFGALTLAGYVIAAFFVIPSPALGLGAMFTSKLGVALIAACALLGAWLGPARLADFFSLLWGTHPAWQSKRVNGAAAWLVLLGIAVFAAWRLRR